MNFDWENLFNISGWIIAIVIPFLGFIITKIRERYTKNVLELSLHNGSRYNNRPNLNVEIYVNHQKVEGSVYDLRLKLSNKGNNDIEGSCFKKPYSIVFPEYATILKAEIVEEPNDDAPSISVNRNNVELTFGSLLKSQKSYSIDVLISVKDDTKLKYTSDDIFEEVTDKIYAKDINKVTKVSKSNKKLFFPISYCVVGIISVILHFYIPNYKLAPEPIFDLKVGDEVICTGYIKCYGDSIYMGSSDKLAISSTSILNDQQTRLIIDPKKQQTDYMKKYQFLYMGISLVIISIVLFLIIKKRRRDSR